MTTRAILIVVVFLFVASFSDAQSLSEAQIAPAFPNQEARKIAEIASWGTVLTAIAWDTKASWQCEHRTQCFAWQGLRLGTAEFATWAIKSVVHRERPCSPSCGIDNPRASFLSGHTVNACQAAGSMGARLYLSLCFGTAEGRILADKHWLTDTLAGALLGWGVGHLRPEEQR